MINVGNGPPGLGFAPRLDNRKELAWFRSKEWGVKREEAEKRGTLRKLFWRVGRSLDGYI